MIKDVFEYISDYTEECLLNTAKMLIKFISAVDGRNGDKASTPPSSPTSMNTQDLCIVNDVKTNVNREWFSSLLCFRYLQCMLKT